MALTYKKRPRHNDGKERAAVFVFVHLTREEERTTRQLAAARNQTLREYLHDLAEEALAQKINRRPSTMS
jgi:hypothetical protein